MSAELISFFFEATLIWGVLLTFYLIAFRNNGNWRVQRYYLITSWTLGMVVPLLPPLFTVDPSTASRLPAGLIDYMVPSIPSVGSLEPSEEVPLPWSHYLLRSWQLGAVVALLASAIGLIRHLHPRPVDVSNFAGLRVVKSGGVVSPYAVFRTIYLPTGLSADLERTALLHEAAHLQRGHPYEQLWLLLGRCIFWFHPVAWAYTRLLSNVHEYEVDAVVSRTVAPRLYCQQLLRATLNPRLVPGLFSSPLKRRIMLLSTNHLTHAVGPVRWLALGIVISSVFLFQNVALRAQQTPSPNQEQTYVPATPVGMPDSVDRRHHLLTTVYREIKYPADARLTGVTGDYHLKLSIDDRGGVTSVASPASVHIESYPDAIVVVGYAPQTESTISLEAGETALVEELERMGRFLQDKGFVPATSNGQPVASVLDLVFSFRLE